MSRGGRHGIEYVTAPRQTRRCECGERANVFADEDGNCNTCGYQAEPEPTADTENALAWTFARIVNHGDDPPGRSYRYG